MMNNNCQEKKKEKKGKIIVLRILAQHLCDWIIHGLCILQLVLALTDEA